MVQFTTKAELLPYPTTPPVCPKCGGHKTEIIGQTDDPTKRVIRCNRCGAISTVSINEDASAYFADASSAA